MRELSVNEIAEVSAGISQTIKAGARLLGRALLSGIAIGSGIGMVIGVAAIAYDVYHELK